MLFSVAACDTKTDPTADIPVPAYIDLDNAFVYSTNTSSAFTTNLRLTGKAGWTARGLTDNTYTLNWNDVLGSVVFTIEQIGEKAAGQKYSDAQDYWNTKKAYFGENYYFKVVVDSTLADETKQVVVILKPKYANLQYKVINIRTFGGEVYLICANMLQIAYEAQLPLAYCVALSAKLST